MEAWAWSGLGGTRWSSIPRHLTWRGGTAAVSGRFRSRVALTSSPPLLACLPSAASVSVVAVLIKSGGLLRLTVILADPCSSRASLLQTQRNVLGMLRWGLGTRQFSRTTNISAMQPCRKQHLRSRWARRSFRAALACYEGLTNQINVDVRMLRVMRPRHLHGERCPDRGEAYLKGGSILLAI